MQIEPSNLSGQSWDDLIASFPDPHILQTWEWGLVKSSFGWDMHPYVWRNRHHEVAAATLVLRRTIPVPGLAGRLRVLYLPKGPLLMDWGDESVRHQVLDDLGELTGQERAIFVKIDPDVPLGTGVPDQADFRNNSTGQNVESELKNRGWVYSYDQVQFRNTVILDLTPPEDTILANMKQKTRYNIRLSARKGVAVRSGNLSDLDELYRMYAETSLRDGFVIRDQGYYRMLWSTFIEAGMVEPLIADVDGEAIAALMLFYFAGRAWYLNGMSRKAHREKMPNYLLQWEAIRRAKSVGCITYDLWGAPDIFDEGDPMWGVYRFKSGLGGRVVRHIGAWDLPVNSVLYPLYTRVLPRALDILRRQGAASTRKQISG